jgi:hypothetical protein
VYRAGRVRLIGEQFTTVLYRASQVVLIGETCTVFENRAGKLGLMEKNTQELFIEQVMLGYWE